MPGVFTVLRTGGDYKASHVERLYRRVKALCGDRVRFFCLSDVPVPGEHIPLKYDWPGWYAKMEICRPDIPGDMLYFDLDTVLYDNIDDILSVGRTTVLRDFYWNRFEDKNYDSVGSGLMYLTPQDRAQVWDYWMSGPDRCQQEAGHVGDQHVFEAVIGKTAARWQDVLPGQVVSYKADIKHKHLHSPPEGARIVCFHGKPRPWRIWDRWVRKVY